MAAGSRRRIVDLSHEIYTDMPQFPASRPLAYVETRRYPIGRHSIGSTLCIFIDHIGTHIDAPLHFNPNGKPINAAPLDIMHSTGVTLDFGHKEPGDTIKPEEVVEKFRELNLTLKPGYVVLFYTGASQKWGTPEYLEHVVEVSPQTVRWLYKQGVMVYGVDAISVDKDLINYPTHSLLLEMEHYIIENLANLDKLIGRAFEFVGYPLKLRGATAAPLRAVGIISE